MELDEVDRSSLIDGGDVLRGQKMKKEKMMPGEVEESRFHQ